MTADLSMVWWVATGLLIALELWTGTVYLLLLALGAAAGGIAAWWGAAPAWQIACAALIGGGTTALWHLQRARTAQSISREGTDGGSLDLGQTVQVTHWAADGTARIQYRGSVWTARQAPLATDTAFPATSHGPGAHQIVGIEGNILLITPASPTAPSPIGVRSSAVP